MGVTADKIRKMRTSPVWPVKSVGRLRAIKGIGAKRMEKMRQVRPVGYGKYCRRKACRVQRSEICVKAAIQFYIASAWPSDKP